MKTYKMILRGRVQGVGFRFFTWRQANQHHIQGWVRNNHDGSVEIWAQGEEGDMESFIGQIQEGPSAAKVTDLKKEVVEHEPFESFQIKG